MPAYSGTNIPTILEQLERDRSWLARKMGLSVSQVWRVLEGQRTITPAFVAKACAVLNRPEDELFFSADDMHMRKRTEGVDVAVA